MQSFPLNFSSRGHSPHHSSLSLRRLTSVVALLAAFSCPIAAKSQTVDSPASAEGMSDITVISVEVGQFDFGPKIIHIYENSRNQYAYANNPSRWQFAIEPLLSLKLSPDGKAELSTIDLEPSIKKIDGKWRKFKRSRIMIPVSIITPNARGIALDVIRTRYPEQACDLGTQNIDALPITSIVVTSTDIQSVNQPYYSTGRIVTDRFSFFTSPSYFNLFFELTESYPGTLEADIVRFREFLPFMQLKATVSFSVKGTSFNLVSVVADKIKSTELYVKLVGDGGETFVHRNDLRRLTQSAAAQLSATAIIEDQASFDYALFSGLINSARTVPADEKWFDDNQGKHTYNEEDLRPSHIQSYLNKVFTKDQGSDQWKVNTSASGGGSFLGIIEANASGAVSTESLKTWLKENNLETEIKGDIIVVKSINLEAVNISKYVNSSNTGVEVKNISGDTLKTNLSTVIFGEAVDDRAAVPHDWGCTEEQKSLLYTR